MRHPSNAAVVEVHASTRACTHAAKQLGIAAFLALFLATTLAHAQPPRTARGTTGAIDVASAQPLRAKAVRDSATPMLVRVNALEAGRYRIEYIGALEGTFDLAPLIEQTDGRAADALPDLRVEVYTQLPPNHGTDVFGLSAPGFSLAAHYTTFLWTAIAAWCAVPAYFIARRVLRAKPIPAPLPPPEPTVSQRLFAIVDQARARELDADERGRLELLLLQELRAASASSASLADATAALRNDQRCAQVVRAVESWLHAPTAGDRSRALAQIDALRSESVDSVISCRATGAAT